MLREELSQNRGSALEEGVLCSFWLGTSFCTERFGSWREEDSQREVLPSARTLACPGLRGDWGRVPRSTSSWAAQSSDLDPDQRVPNR